MSHENEIDRHERMKRRDEFAKAALPSLLLQSAPGLPKIEDESNIPQELIDEAFQDWFDNVAERAYQLADRMEHARCK